jgi:hypothetical protein
VVFGSGVWLRCVGFSGCLTLGVYTIIHYYIILYYTLLFPSLPNILISSSPSPSPFLPSFYPPLLPPNIHSILVGTYIYLFIFQTHQQSDPAQIIGGMSRVV